MKNLMTVDVARLPLNGADAEAMLDESLKKIRHSPHLHILKVVHGDGSHGRGATLKTVVKNWIQKNQARIISSIDGAELSPTNPHVQVLLAECNLTGRTDFASPNEGITIVWVS